MLAGQRELTAEELRLVEPMLAKPNHGGIAAAELAQFKNEARGQLSASRDITMIGVQLHLLGLRELDPNAVWSGTPDRIAQAEREIRRTAPEARVENELGTRTVRLGEHTLVLHEVEASGAQSNAKDAPKAPAPATPHPDGEQPARTPYGDVWPGDARLPEPAGAPGRGTIALAKVDEAIAGARPALTGCFERAQRGAWGRLALRLDVDGEGRVDDVTEVESTFPDADVTACAAAVLRGLPLPAPDGGEARTIAALRWSAR